MPHASGLRARSTPGAETHVTGSTVRKYRLVLAEQSAEGGALPRNLARVLLAPRIRTPGEVVLWSLISERVDAAAFGILRATLAPEERAQADRFLRESDRTVYTAAHALLRVMLSAHVTHPARFRTNEWGKP